VRKTTGKVIILYFLIFMGIDRRYQYRRLYGRKHSFNLNAVSVFMLGCMVTSPSPH
jgi:hypothetical protein